MPWDDDDDHDNAGESVLDALDEYVPAKSVDDPWGMPEPPRTEESDDVDTLLVTAMNPAGTVLATALMNGQLLRVELTSDVTRMTEAELAEEIAVISTLARKQGQAAQHAFVAEFMRQLGHDPAGTRAFLEREIGLPSPHTVIEERARVFSARYTDDG
jgi:hypothetical protein